MQEISSLLPEILDRVVQRLDYQTCVLLSHRSTQSPACQNSFWIHRTLKLGSREDLQQAELLTATRIARRINASAATLDDVDLDCLAQHFQVITHLNVSNNPEVTDDGLETVLHHHGKSLKRLCLGRLFRLSNCTLENIAKYCTSLKSLDLEGCMFTMSGLQTLLQPKSNNLRRLNISRCHLLDTRGLGQLAIHMNSLKKLSISHIDQVEPYQIQLLLEHCPLLKEVDITSCPEFTLKSVRALKGIRAHLQIRHNACMEDHSIEGVRRFLLSLVYL